MTSTSRDLAEAEEPAEPELPVPALDALLRSMADDEFVIGCSDSEWTGIAPILEEDIAMSSTSTICLLSDEGPAAVSEQARSSLGANRRRRLAAIVAGEESVR